MQHILTKEVAAKSITELYVYYKCTRIKKKLCSHQKKQNKNMILQSLFITKLYCDSASTIVTNSFHLEEKPNS